ncbi:MAG TPA: hypothetical protein VG733_00095, partial [Chthoniobacteraceae bacterium]|nr:hypothetical protein [Chthoniobacteraceae bacterium]
GIKVTKEEFNRRLDLIAMQRGETREKLLKEIGDRSGVLEEINDELLRGKVLDFLASDVSVQSNS